eukprot:scaffold10895_cov129-Isochrysis_galbana.AAC.1
MKKKSTRGVDIYETHFPAACRCLLSPRGKWDDSGTAPPPSHGHLSGCPGDGRCSDGGRAVRLQPPSLTHDLGHARGRAPSEPVRK